jgi:hypothetical protein
MQRALDPGKRANIIAILGVGGTRTLAAEFVGCHPQTITNTAKSDPQFAEDLRHAESSSEVHLLTSITNASKGVAHAAKWALERLYPNTYGRRKPGTYSVEDIKQLLIELANRLAGAAVTEEERTRSLTTMAQFGKEMILATAPFVEQAIPLHAEINALREYWNEANPITSESEPEPTQSEPALGSARDPKGCPVEPTVDPQTILDFTQAAGPTQEHRHVA